MPQPTIQHTLPSITIHIKKEEMEELLIKTAKEKSQGYRFAFMESDKYGGYKLTFVKTEG